MKKIIAQYAKEHGFTKIPLASLTDMELWLLEKLTKTK